METGESAMNASPYDAGLGPIGSKFAIKDSGERTQFTTGAVRDTEKGKPRYDLISVWADKRKAEHMAKGAEKYEDRNWEKGMQKSRLLSSARRHFMQYLQGDQSEDHLAAAAFNIDAVMHFEETGWPDGMNDMPHIGKLAEESK